MKPTPSKKCNRAGDKTLTFWFHADSQALVISARLTNVAGLERNHAAAVARTLILETVAFFHTTSEETLHTHTHTHTHQFKNTTRRTTSSFIYFIINHNNRLISQHFLQDNPVRLASEGFHVAPDGKMVLRGWLRGTVVEGRSLTGELSLSCARPAADG